MKMRWHRAQRTLWWWSLVGLGSVQIFLSLLKREKFQSINFESNRRNWLLVRSCDAQQNYWFTFFTLNGIKVFFLYLLYRNSMEIFIFQTQNSAVYPVDCCVFFFFSNEQKTEVWWIATHSTCEKEPQRTSEAMRYSPKIQKENNAIFSDERIELMEDGSSKAKRMLIITMNIFWPSCHKLY